MPNCSAICINGNACQKMAQQGQKVCGVHSIVVRLCGRRMNNGYLCTNTCVEGRRLCNRHYNDSLRRVRKRRIEELCRESVDRLWITGNVEEVRVFLQEGLGDLQATQVEVERAIGEFEDEIDEFLATVVAPRQRDNKPVGELHILAADNQNVHTPAVTKQTESGLQILLDTQPAVGQDTLKEMKESWLSIKKERQVNHVLKDMKGWYNKKTCRVQNDYMYKHALDGVWTHIKISTDKEELVKRLWEECYESVGVCCEGHISRLCNILVGFDEAFATPLSVGENLQQRMASIAGEDIGVLHKVKKAWDCMEELGIPLVQREAWIDAL